MLGGDYLLGDTASQPVPATRLREVLEGQHRNDRPAMRRQRYGRVRPPVGQRPGSGPRVASVAGSLMGNVVPRVEDPELVQGEGIYVDDITVAGVLHLAFVRSPFAHARVRVDDVETARAAPGVVGVFTAPLRDIVGVLQARIDQQQEEGES